MSILDLSFLFASSRPLFCSHPPSRELLSSTRTPSIPCRSCHCSAETCSLPRRFCRSLSRATLSGALYLPPSFCSCSALRWSPAASISTSVTLRTSTRTACSTASITLGTLSLHSSVPFSWSSFSHPTPMQPSPNHALQRTAPCVTAPASAAAFPPAMQVPRRTPRSLSLGSLGVARASCE